MNFDQDKDLEKHPLLGASMKNRLSVLTAATGTTAMAITSPTTNLSNNSNSNSNTGGGLGGGHGHGQGGPSEMTPVSPKSPNYYSEEISVKKSISNLDSRIPHKNGSNDASSSLIHLFTALKRKLQHGLLGHELGSIAYTRECMELCSLLTPLLKRDILSDIPTEISFKVLECLDIKTIVSARLVNKQWRGLIDGRGADLAIWKKKVAREFPHLLVQRLDPLDQRLHMRTFKTYYQFNFLTRRNWFLGKNKRISFPGHGGNVVTSLLVVGDKIISGSDDQSIHIYDINKGELVKRLLGHDGGVWALQNYGNALVSGSTDRTVRVWNMETGKCTHVFEGHTSTVRCLLIIPQDDPTPPPSRRESRMTRSTSSVLYQQSPAANLNTNTPPPPLFVTGSRDANIRVWTLPDLSTKWPPPVNTSTNPYLRHVLQGHTNSVRAIAGHAHILVSGSYDTTVRVWDILTGACLHVFHAHREKVYSVGYSHELKRAVSGSMDATVRVWDTVTGTPLFTLEGHNSLVGLLELTPQYLISAAADSTLRVWDPISGKCLAILSGHEAAITCFMHDPPNNRIVSGSDGGIKVWELSSGGYPGLDMHSISHIIPSATKPLAQTPTSIQTSSGAIPIHGRFVGDVITQVRGVWRTRMDSHRLVSAVQTADEKTWFEVLDFSEGPEIGTMKKTAGDRFFRDENDDDDDEDDDVIDDQMDEDFDEEDEDM